MLRRHAAGAVGGGDGGVGSPAMRGCAVDVTHHFAGPGGGVVADGRGRGTLQLAQDGGVDQAGDIGHVFREAQVERPLRHRLERLFQRLVSELDVRQRRLRHARRQLLLRQCEQGRLELRKLRLWIALELIGPLAVNT